MARPDLTPERLGPLIEADDVAGVVAAFDGASDKDRARVREMADLSWAGLSTPAEANDAAVVAFAATAAAGPASLHLSWRINYGDERVVDAISSVIGQRPDRFRTSFAKRILRSDPSYAHWRLLRPLVRAGAIDPSVDDDAYIRTLGCALDAGTFVDDPTLVDRELWRIFEVPGTLTQYLRPGWTDAFTAVAASDPEARARLVDATMGVLAMDLRPGELGAYARLAEALAPTDAELGTRIGAIEAVCGAHQSVRKLGVAWLGRVVVAGTADPGAAAEALRTPLAGTQKQLALSSLKLLDRLAATTDVATTVAVTGLGHPHPDVQEKALSVVERHAGPTPPAPLRAELLGWVDVVPAAIRPRVAALAGAPTPSPRAAATGHHPATVPTVAHPTLEAAYRDDRRLVPTDDLDELVALAAAALEGRGSGDDLERLVAGIARQAGTRATGFTDLVSPIRKRAGQRLGGTQWDMGASPRAVAGFVLAWTDGVPPQLPSHLATSAGRGGLLARFRGEEVPARPPTVTTLLWHRLHELGARVAAGAPCSPWSEPSHRGGHLDPRTLAERASRTEAVGPWDLRAARMRAGQGTLAPSLRADHDRPPREKRFGKDLVPLVFTPADATGAPDLPDDPLLAAGVRYFGLDPVEREDLRFRAPWWDTGNELDAMVAIGDLCARPDLVGAAAAVRLGERVIGNQSGWYSPGPLLGTLSDPAVAVSGSVLTMASIGLSSEAEFRSLAVDGLIAAVDDARLDPDLLGAELAALQRAGLVVLTRLGEPMVDVASAGEVHRAVAQQVLLTLVAHLDDRPSGIHGPLDALVTLAGDGRTRIPEAARPVLDDLAGRSTRAGKAAKALLSSAL